MTPGLVAFSTRRPWIVLVCALVLSAIFVAYAAALYRRYSDRLAHATFRYSITYLALLFAALLVDHYL